MITGCEDVQEGHHSLGGNGVVLEGGLLQQVDATKERDVPAEPVEVAVAEGIVIQLEASHGEDVLPALPPGVDERLPERGVESLEEVATDVDQVEVADGGEGEGL